MLFKVTHIDERGHRRKARVAAPNAGDAMDQVDREWGEARVVACMRMTSRPVLHVVTGVRQAAAGGATCGF